MKHHEINEGDFAEIDVKPGEQYTVIAVETEGEKGHHWHVIERQVPEPGVLPLRLPRRERSRDAVS